MACYGCTVPTLTTTVKTPLQPPTNFQKTPTLLPYNIVLRLYSENDRLKILELEDRKKIQHLLGKFLWPEDTTIVGR